jgi:hypothetical protein
MNFESFLARLKGVSRYGDQASGRLARLLMSAALLDLPADHGDLGVASDGLVPDARRDPLEADHPEDLKAIRVTRPRLERRGPRPECP